MNSDYSFVPFCTIASGILSETEATAIELNDTSGVPINCNYIRVVRAGAQAISTTDLNSYSGFWYVRPEIGYYDPALDVADRASAGNPEGAGAYMAGPGESVIEIRLPKGKFCTSISIGNLLADEQDFGITYGFIQPASPIEKIAARNKGV